MKLVLLCIIAAACIQCCSTLGDIKQVFRQAHPQSRVELPPGVNMHQHIITTGRPTT
jgi:hypothetical protein